MFGSRADLQRVRRPNEHHRVTFIELFFDLVFVFGITQLSHALAAHLSLVGALETGLMFLAVWWAWIYTCWFTNWLDPGRTPVRVLMLALMLAGLVLSISVPRAFEDYGLKFAVAYVCMQAGRSLFMLWALRRHNPGNYRNFQRVVSWQILTAVLWVAGGLSHDGFRLVFWGMAILTDMAVVMIGFWTPWLGRSTTADWNVEGAHMAERCALFVIIALGESILVTGKTVAELQATPGVMIAFAAAFLGSVSMWWIYFDTAAERASRSFVTTTDSGRMAVSAYTYVHLPLVAGIVVTAVGDELALAHPDGRMEAKVAAVLLAGPALYLFGDLLFRRATAAPFPRSHIGGLAALAVLAPVSLTLSPALLSAAVALVLTGVAASEAIWLRRARARATA
ncbi:low temperature requirement protein A [Phenylobacterium sp.]|uniref:low temperature requirement protein A n=1 Tax=Phenylobacterium sp. TaxID=1871053 RepID=UPI002FC83C63